MMHAKCKIEVAPNAGEELVAQVARISGPLHHLTGELQINSLSEVPLAYNWEDSSTVEPSL